MRKQTKVNWAITVGAGVMIAVAVPTTLFAQSKNQVLNTVGNAADGKIIVIPWESVGQVRSGMTTNEVISVLGRPEKMQGRIMVYAKTFGIAIVAPGKTGVSAIFCGDSSGDGPCVKIFKGRTREGIGMESSRAEIIKALGQPTSAKPWDADLHQGGIAL